MLFSKRRCESSSCVFASCAVKSKLCFVSSNYAVNQSGWYTVFAFCAPWNQMVFSTIGYIVFIGNVATSYNYLSIAFAYYCLLGWKKGNCANAYFSAVNK